MTIKSAAPVLEDQAAEVVQGTLAPAPAGTLAYSDTLLMFERLVCDPNASADKIERLMVLLERREARRAEVAFNVAMTEAQQAMHPVDADAYNPATKSRYLSYEALDEALRPIYTEHGFGMSFSTGDSAQQMDELVILCLVTHIAGHSRQYQIRLPADGKGAKGGDVMTKTHATGSAVTYGMRYLSKMIWNVAVGQDDDDGNRASVPTAQPPQGYDDWWTDMQAAADNGMATLEPAWAKSKSEYKSYTVRHNKAAWDRCKKIAAVAGARASQES